MDSTYLKENPTTVCLIYVLDLSGDMDLNKFEVLKQTMKDTVIALEAEADYNDDLKIEIAVLTYNTKPEWLTPKKPKKIEAIDFENLNSNHSDAINIGLTLNELDSKLNTDSFLGNKNLNIHPVFIFITNGPTLDNPSQYEAALDKIKSNEWFDKAVKIGVALDKEADLNVLTNITGDSEAVIELTNLNEFQKMIRQISTYAVRFFSNKFDFFNSKGKIILNEVKDRNHFDRFINWSTWPVITSGPELELPDGDEWEYDDDWED